MQLTNAMFEDAFNNLESCYKQIQSDLHECLTKGPQAHRAGDEETYQKYVAKAKQLRNEEEPWLNFAEAAIIEADKQGVKPDKYATVKEVAKCMRYRFNEEAENKDER